MKFLDFIIERERIRLKKESDQLWPWSEDEIFQTYSFTNVKRKYDKTSIEFIKLYEKFGTHYPPEICLLNCAMFRQFGTIDFVKYVGWQPLWVPDHLRKIAKEQKILGKKLFTGAYMVTTVQLKGEKIDCLIDGVLNPLWENLPILVDIIKTEKTFQAAHTELRKNNGFGGSGFMAKEMLLDSFYCKSVWDNPPLDNETWTGIGPGSRRGVNRYLDLPIQEKTSEELVLNTIIEIYNGVKNDWPFDEKLEIHDVQFQLCEHDKYMRVKNGEGKPRKKYKNLTSI